MRQTWELIKDAANVFNPRTWHDSIALRIAKWFGISFWLWLAIAISLAAVQVWLLCYVELPAAVRALIAVMDVLATAALLSLVCVITSFGTHDLTAPVLLLNFFRRMYPEEYMTVGVAARLYQNPAVAVLQKRNVIVELTAMPYSIRIFTKYISRVAAVTLLIPLYLGMALSSLRVVPHQHLVDERDGGGGAIHTLEVLRDIQMGVLGGTSTEHMLPVDNSDSMGSGGWEIVLAFSTSLYLTLVLVLLPMQIGIVGNLDRHLKSQGFWRNQLKTWPAS